MPPLPAVSKVVRVALSFTPGTTPFAISRFYIQYTGTAPTVAQLGTFNGAVATAFGANASPLLSANYLLSSITSIDLSSATSAEATTATATAGTRAGTNVPIDNCLVSSYTIARRYRGGHPRGYWPFGVVADLTTPRAWTSAFVTLCTTDLASFFTAVAGAGWAAAGTLSQVNVSYFQGFHVVTNPITGRARNVPLVRGAPVVDAVTALRAQPSVGSQRRRIQFVD